MGVSVERGTTDDVDALVDLWVALARGQRQYGSHILTEDNRTQIRESIVRHAVDDRLFVARSDDEVVGFVMFTLQSGTYQQDVTRGIVENLYVTPDARGDGVGASLLEEAQQALAERGADAVTLEVMADNERARDFYTRHGYDTHRIELERSLENDTHSKGGE